MCKQERDRYPAKIVESIAKNAGHDLIEMVWGGGGVLKNYVATENKDMTLKSVEELFRKRHAELKDQSEFPSFGRNAWRKSNELRKTTENQTFQLIFKLKSCVLNYI